MSHAHAKEIFNQAVELSAAQRAAYLESACGQDADLRAVVESLLKYYETDGPGNEGSSPPAHADLQPGEVLGPYRIVDVLGEGGMGIVYLAEQSAPVRRLVAIKVLKPGMDSKAVLNRFHAEQQAMALMDHPGIATVLQTGTTTSGRPWFAMEYIEGDRLGVYCDLHCLDTLDRLDLFARVCDAVQHAHQKGVIHRDLKPSNILITVDDYGQPHPRIIDFGIAKAMAEPLTEATLMTSQGQLVGTLAYMSPEQLDLSGALVDTRTDVYALGVVLYELLSGQLPFETGTMHEVGIDSIRHTIRHAEPPKPSTRLTTIDPSEATRIADSRSTRIDDLERQLRLELEWIPLKALRKSPDERYYSPESMAADVRRYLKGEPLEAGPPSRIYKLKKVLKRNKLPVATLAGFAILLIIGTAVSLTLWWSANTARYQSQQEMARAEAVQNFLTDMLASADPRKAGTMDKELMKHVLSTASLQVEDDFAEQPLVAATVRNIIGSTYYHLGLYKEASPHLVEALTIREQHLGEEHAETLKSLMNRSMLAMGQGDFPLAEDGYRRTLEIRTRTLGDEHPDTLETLANLGNLVRQMGRLNEAEELTRTAMEAHRRVHGDEHPNTLNTIGNMGILMAMRNRYEEAEPYFRETLDTRLRILGESHPSTLNTMGNMATLLWSLGNLEEADQQYQRLIDIRSRVQGEEHPSVLSALGNYGNLLLEMGRVEDARTYRLKTLELKLRVLGEDHPSTLTEYVNTGNFYGTTGNMLEAERYYRMAWEGERKALGDQHPNTLSSQARLGMVLRDLKRFEEAEDLLQTVYRFPVKSSALRQKMPS